MSAEEWLPIVFMMLMGLAVLIYAILDGYDLGVGMLLARADEAERDLMIASIGPFWDANETWLVLGIGILLVAFPLAHGIILTALYLPATFMLIGLILRGVAFDFRVKAHAHHKPAWNWAFIAGSALASFAQGYMLGMTIIGFKQGFWATAFALLIGACLCAGYALLGASWLIMKTEQDLQVRAIRWARRSLWLTTLGVAAVSIATPLVSRRIFVKWFSLPDFFLLLPIPLMTAVLLFALDRILRKLPRPGDRWNWVPFVSTAAVFVLAFHGLAYSLYPFLVVDSLNIWDAASAPESLLIILIGAAVVLPTILAYTIYSYSVFWGKAKELSYD
ncbi:MAG: cytochrome d ubiquinol oxidase subunit II [Burkholderiaceae bacterium]|nr:MAG: cytochrome d ubiquinol oxidase subunit II [Burkholderiaceae bacterium]